MKIILLQDVKAQGKKGDVIEVSEGYARNFLLSKGGFYHDLYYSQFDNSNE